MRWLSHADETHQIRLGSCLCIKGAQIFYPKFAFNTGNLAMLENVHYVKRDSRLLLQYGEVVCSNFLVIKVLSIVIVRNWLGNPANFKGTNKDQKIYVGGSTTLDNLLFCTHTPWPNYVTVTFLLVSSSGTNHDLLCFVQGHGQKSEQKHRTKNFAKLPTHLPLLTIG